jgi:hypothetical protein
MALTIEWRRRTEGDETILAIEDGRVVGAWAASTDLLMDYLNDMKGLDIVKGESKTNGVDHTQRAPRDWGELVIARSEDGEVLTIDPGLYWEGIAYWFRSRGLDPHPAHPVTTPSTLSWTEAAQKRT